MELVAAASGAPAYRKTPGNHGSAALVAEYFRARRSRHRTRPSTTARTTLPRKRRPRGKPPCARTTSTQSSGSRKFEDLTAPPGTRAIGSRTRTSAEVSAPDHGQAVHSAGPSPAVRVSATVKRAAPESRRSSAPCSSGRAGRSRAGSRSFAFGPSTGARSRLPSLLQRYRVCVGHSRCSTDGESKTMSFLERLLADPGAKTRRRGGAVTRVAGRRDRVGCRAVVGPVAGCGR
jgi:hypothetical protein